MISKAMITTDDILSAFSSPILQPGLRPEILTQLNQLADSSLPQPYIALMSRTNGIEGFLSDVNYLVIWPFEQLAEANEGYGVKAFAPDLFLFGSNGGDAGYVFDTRLTPMSVLEVPFVGQSMTEVKLIGNSFEEFLMALRGG